MFVVQFKNAVQRLIRQLLLILPIFYIFNGCANRGIPLGGPKDVDPPKVLATSPPDKSVNYIPEQEIEITFDEYVALKDAYQEIIVSPPLKENVITSVNNKSVIVEFPDEAVFDTTTYTICFGKSIADNNEGNLLSNYEFVFSLKNYIDSLNVVGKVVNSFNLKPEKERFYVMLYKNLTDSSPIKEKPKFISRTDEKGDFSIHNIEDGKYRIFALRDLNNNMLFDLPEEQIAFADSVIELVAEKIATDSITELDKKLTPEIPKNEIPDNKKTDKSSINDTIKTDTLIKPRKYSLRQELRFFKEKVKNQYMTNNERTRPELLYFTFNQTLADSLKIEPLNVKYSDNWYLPDINRTFDTLKLWLIDTSLISKDSLQFKLNYPVYDSTGLMIIKTDTLFLNYRSKDVKTPRVKKRKETEEKLFDSIPKPSKKLALSNSINNASTFDLNRKISVSSQTPLNKVNTEKILVYKIEDTLEIPLKSINITDRSLYGFTIGFKPDELTQYKILLPDSALSDIYEAVNDTTVMSFKTQSEAFYGVLTMNLKNIKGPVILQLMDEKENILRENLISTDQPVRYEYLHPENYILKLIVDSNNNGKWDTGKYLKHLQPEKVIYYPQVITVRSNWEIELNWEIQD
jgi:hypothetical protein